MTGSDWLIVSDFAPNQPYAVPYRGMQAPDHPVLLSMPETAYLKCFALRKVEGENGGPPARSFPLISK